MNKKSLAFLFLILSGFILLFFELRWGKFEISWSEFTSYLVGSDTEDVTRIIMNSRLIRAITAMLGGAGLALAGLIMQTYFRNALAGPSVLGISSGSGLAVALVLMISGTGLSFGEIGQVSVPVAAMFGAFAILVLISFLSRFLKSSVSLLIMGLMISYLTSSLIGVLQFNASESNLKAFVVWGLGSFADVDSTGIYVILITFIVSLGLVIGIHKHLNVFLLGESYARSMGVPVQLLKSIMILVTGLLVGVITAYCGPVSFLGLAVPHLARSLFKSSDHKIILPAVIILGLGLGIGCDFISRASFYEGGLPLNTVTSLIGAPVVIYYLLRRSKAGEYV